jgi:hypothetical protein
VYHWLPENSKMQSSIVMKIDLLCTKFKSWDEKVLHCTVYYVYTMCSNNVHCILAVGFARQSYCSRFKRAQLLQ